MSIEESADALAIDGVVVSQVNAPASIDELRALLANDATHAMIIGGGTKMSTGNLGGPFDLAISTRRLNQVLHYEPADLTVAVEPGVTVAELTELLGASNQTLPFDCPDPTRSTIGGMFASATGGPRRLRYGSLRDWVLGLDVMDGNGLVTRSGGMVVKNVTGYDLARLHYGAHGAFGIVTRLNLKVLPQEPAARSVLLSYASALEAHTAGVAVLGSQLEPTSILVSHEDTWTLAVGCEGPEVSIDRQARSIVDLASSTARPDDVVVDKDRRSATAPYLETVEHRAGQSVARLSIPASHQVEALHLYGALSGSRLCADLGSGLLFIAGPSSIEWREAIRRTAEWPVFLSLPPELKRGIDMFGGMDAPNARIVTSLKSAYDPDNRFNRGRFALGL
jgi:glycolate oxidase FAD binding subunit